jgi:hypothetical protein
MKRIDIVPLIIIFYGSFIFNTIVGRFSLYYGDDGPFFGYLTQMYASNFPFFIWEPHFYSGHPMTGFGAITFLPMVLLVKLVFSLTDALYYSFWFYFILLGLSLYYLAKQLAPRWVAAGVPFLAWTATTYWNSTIWGGSYDRAFALSFLFMAIAATYKYVSAGPQVDKKHYFMALASWVIVLFSNEHMVLQFMFFAPLFVLFGYGSIKTGIKKLLILLIPALGFTIQAWGRLAYYILTTSNLAAQNDTRIFPISWLYTSGTAFEHTLGYLPVPILLTALGAIAYYKLSNRPVIITTVKRGLILSMSLAGAYYLIMGWIPLLWSYLPRFESTLDSIADLGTLLLILIPTLIGIAVTGRKQTRIIRLGSVIFFIVTLVNVTFIIPTIPIADWEPSYTATNNVLNQLYTYPSEQRLGVMFKYITPWINLVHSGIETTGGRIPILDAKPLYDSWFNDVVFYSGINPAQLSYVLIEDKPPVYKPYFAIDPLNTAPANFWLDWYGTKTAIFAQYEPVKTAASIYSMQPFFNYSTALSYRPFNLDFIGVTNPSVGTIVEETNAKILGFVGSDTNYNVLLASLSQLGLGPTYIIPLKLNPADVNRIQLDALIIDAMAYPSLSPTTTTNTMILYQNLPTNPTPTDSYSLIKSLFPTMIQTFVEASPSGTAPFPTMTIPLNIWDIVNTSANYANPTWHSWAFVSPENQTASATLPFSWTGLTQSAVTFSNQIPFPIRIDNATILLGLQSSVDTTATLNFTSPHGFRFTNTMTLPANKTIELRLTGRDFGTSAFGRVIYLGNVLNINFHSPITETHETFNIVNPRIILALQPATGYVYQLGKTLVDSQNAALVISASAKGDMNLVLINGNKNASALNVQVENGITIIPLTRFSGHLSVFDTIETSRHVDSIKVISLSPTNQMPLNHTWVNGREGTISGIRNGFNGIIFKETYNSNWKFSMGPSALQAYQAGPGMIFLPLPAQTQGMIYFIFNPYDTIFDISVVMILVTATTLLWYAGAFNSIRRKS